MRSIVSLIPVVVVLVAPVVAHADTDLICRGKVSDIVTTSAPARNAVATSVDGQMRFHLTDKSGRVDLPPQMVPGPGLSFKKKSATQDLHDYKISDTAYSGFIPAGLGNKMVFAIDRQTGNVTVTGAAEFSGACEKYDASAVAKLF